ncbi:MAG: MBL fold metallo-hydrolase [Proteobacteria bacterium]|nr:MBL fold metallo-hydrolase [Pseudomonadota bacterium]
MCVAATLADGTRLFLDAGTGVRAFGKDLFKQGLDKGPVHFLLSHRHYDHIIGLPFFEPIYTPELHLIVHPIENEVQERRRARAQIFDGIQTPMKLSQLPSRIEFDPGGEPDDDWGIGSARVSRIKLNHPGGAQGFRIQDADGASLTYLTDNELVPPGDARTTPEEQAAFAHRTGLMIADSQYMPEDLPAKAGWGHSTVPQVLQLAKGAQAHTALLFHHDPDRSDAALDAIGEQASEFASSQMDNGPILVASEGMRFDIKPDACVRLDDRG